ncbi:MAG: class I SAM-dependent methyltransferase [Alphaproteobacteria bacterium]
MSSRFSLLRNLAWLIARPLLRLARNFANLHGSWRLRRLGYLGFVAARPAGALAPQGGDLWFLYRLVRAQKPRLVMELGSGCSTVILAQALYDNAQKDPNRNGRIISLDGMADWAEVTRASLPEHLAGICEIRHAEAVEEDRGDDRGFRYAELPDGNPDLLYVDGPALRPDRKICFDALHLQDRFPPGFAMVVDGRHDTVRYFRRHLAGRYRISRNHWLHNTRFDLLP